MRRFACIALFSCAAAVALWAQPKVAVLDAVVPNNLDQSVVVPVTEKIIERLVVSGRYTVLDRANVGQVLKEREFQVSGLVSDAEITEAGKYLGADFVVVAKVQRVSDTYFLTAKMIAVKTGVIANQTSAENEGKLSILIKLAERVGDVLSGGTVLAPAAADPNNRPAEAPSPKAVEPVKPPVKPASDANRVGLRLYAGLGSGTQDLDIESGSSYSYNPLGFDVYALWGVFGNWGLTGNVTFLSDTENGGASITSADIGIAYVLPIGILLPWASLKFGVAAIDWPNFYDYTASGTEFAFDLGLDVRLGSILVGARYQLQAASFPEDSGHHAVTSFQNSFWLMGGMRF